MLDQLQHRCGANNQLCHIHLIPRRQGDIDDPKGGVQEGLTTEYKIGIDMPTTSLLINPPVLYSRSTVLSQPCPVSQDRGLYAFFF